MSGFQKTVNVNPAPGIEGDFWGANPRFSLIAGDSQLTAGAAGVLVGRFARARNDNGKVSNGHPGVACRLGFVQRDQPVLITAWLGEASMTVPAGLEITLFDSADVFARFAGGANIGDKVFASYADGSAIAGTAGTPPQGAAVTASTTSASNVLTVTAVGSGALAVGDPITGAGIPAGTTITAFGTGTGGLGTYTMSANATATATGVAVTAAGASETDWWVHSVALAGETAKIATRRPQ